MHDLQHYDNGCSIRVDIEVALSDERSIIESFGDVGSTPNEALANSCYNFTTGPLHVFLSSLWNCHDDQQVLKEIWTINSNPWDVYLGNIVRKAAGGIDVPVPSELMPVIETLISAEPISQDIHWLRVYYANMPSHNQIVEVLLDNEPWEQGHDEIQNMPWPVMETFYSVRMFLMMSPIQPQPREI
ncbi:MAG: hypothetical protein F6K19_27700 [Cyanothece sp. SIO1E1]|nr:hypothetical protein [Cyanothece sp. SIO1E1]